MSEKQFADIQERVETLLKIRKAPSQFVILFQLLSTGRTMSVKEISNELSLTPKATERAVAKLLEKNLIQRSPFKDGSYLCDQKQIILTLFIAVSNIYEEYEKKKPTPFKTYPDAPVVEEAPRLQST